MTVKVLDVLSALITIMTFVSSLFGEDMFLKLCLKAYFVFPMVFVYICFRTCVVSRQFNLYKYMDEVVREITKNIGSEMGAHPLTRYCYCISTFAIGIAYWNFCNHIPITNSLIHNLLGIDILLILLAAMILLITSVRYDCDVYESLRRTSIITPILGIIATLIEIVILLAWYIRVGM